MPHFLDLHTLPASSLRAILASAKHMKAEAKQGRMPAHLQGKHLAMIFEKPSTRTRVSFEVGIQQLGGQAVFLESNSTQLHRGESIADTARVLSRYIDLMMVRCFDHATLETYATHATVPVINGLTNYSHPCQIMADIMTAEEHQGPIEKQTVAWVGDCNNVTHSWAHAACTLGFPLRIATPPSLKPDAALLAWAKKHGDKVSWGTDPVAAVKNADVVVTDTWFSMGEETHTQKAAQLAPFQVTGTLMQHAKPTACFLHCLPAHRGEEVTGDVMDGPQSLVFDEAENRLHVQKAIMLWCMGEVEK